MHRGLFLLVAVIASCSGRGHAPPPRVDGLCTLEQACWPSRAEWDRLAASLTGELTVPGPTSATAGVTNPFAVQDEVSGTLTTAWFGAWTAAPSAYAVEARNADDIAAAVRFAREHRIRLVIKGTGHDYLGRSSAPDSLLVWTHHMRAVTIDDSFTPTGCAVAPTPAVTVEAGTRWLEAYRAVTVEHGRYVQGGGCTSVGAAGGFLQGGGFGSWSKKYGIAAASMLEAEVVTADGRLLTANACQNEDLFWALRGGGGGTFGVVTRVTLATHELPEQFGLVLGSITATSDDAFVALIEQFLRFYDQSLANEHWGEQANIRGDNSIALSMAFLGMTAKEAEAVWQPLRAWIEERPDRYAIQLAVVDVPGTKMWNAAYLKEHFGDAIRLDPRAGQPADQFWWAGDEGQVSAYVIAYRSRWIPADRFAADAAPDFAKTLFEASRHWAVSLHFNKGQAGASADAVARGRETAMNPAVFDAAALAIMSADARTPETEDNAAIKARVDAAADLVIAATPGAGSYVNEADYFEADWQETFWGASYPRLLAIKRVYDPDGFFRCHHCVGSE